MSVCDQLKGGREKDTCPSTLFPSILIILNVVAVAVVVFLLLEPKDIGLNLPLLMFLLLLFCYFYYYETQIIKKRANVNNRINVGGRDKTQSSRVESSRWRYIFIRLRWELVLRVHAHQEQLDSA